MAAIPSRRVVFEENRPVRCAHSGPHLIYDDPHIFRVRSQHSVPHSFSCDACWKAAKQQQHPNANIQHPKRCSRLPPSPADLERLSRPRTAPPQRTASNCNWDNFMKRKSKYAITTPHGLCDLASDQQNSENRPAFVNYGGRYTDKPFGQKRTFNSLAIHQLKHREVDEERLTSLLRERRLRHQAGDYFREMERRRLHDHDTYQPPEDYNGEGTFSRH